MKVWMLMILSMFSLSSLQAQEEEKVLPTQEQIAAYMSAYDSQYDDEYKEIFSKFFDRLIVGRESLDNDNICMGFESHKQQEVDLLNELNPDYHQQLGRLDGLWDARKVGCQGAFEHVASLKKRYNDEIKTRLALGTNLGEKIVIIKLELLGYEPADLPRSCLNHERLQGLIEVFLKDELVAGDRLDYTQSHCSAIARQVNEILNDVAVAHANSQDIAAESNVPVRVFSGERRPADGAATR
jgi:hypothetical protein